MQFRTLPRFFSRFGLRLGLGLGVLLGSAGLVLATTLSLFVARHTGAVVRVEWAVSTETDLTSFNLSRKLPNENDFTPVSTLAPTGRLAYAYTDTCLLLRPLSLPPGPVQYRLTLRGPGPDQEYLTTMSGASDPVQRAWGTIKAMFR